jgi:hypothetical protein
MLDKKITYTEILKLIENLLASDGIDTKVDGEMQLIGGDSVLDSMKLVELCITPSPPISCISPSTFVSMPSLASKFSISLSISV